MYSFEFKSKLSRVNSSLYVDESRRNQVKGDYFTSGIYSRRKQRSKKAMTNTESHYAGAAREYLLAGDRGELDEFVCGCPSQWVPEYDVFDLESGKILSRGWRSIALDLVKKGHASIDRVRRVFRCSDLGRSQYDIATYEGKLSWARGPKWKSRTDLLKEKLGIHA